MTNITSENCTIVENREWPKVSVLFVTYSRFNLLEETLKSFIDNTEYPALELVIADDGSPEEIQEKILTLPADIFCLSPRNRGLGSNNNAGIRSCTGKYILMVQDDWRCHGPSDYLKNCVAALERNPQIGLINFAGAAHPIDPAEKVLGLTEYCFLTPYPMNDGTKEFFLYSDQPHIISWRAIECVGLYKEDRDMEVCERDYELRWAAQRELCTAVFPKYYKVTFTDQGGQYSFRTTRFRYRISSFLAPVSRLIKSKFPALFSVSKSMVIATIAVMERLRLVR
jgi:glycosyltransferase involved in cell wall biosynthesis